MESTVNPYPILTKIAVALREVARLESDGRPRLDETLQYYRGCVMGMYRMAHEVMPRGEARTLLADTMIEYTDGDHEDRAAKAAKILERFVMGPEPEETEL